MSHYKALYKSTYTYIVV